MQLTEQIATQLRHLYFGGNWTAVNMKDTLAGVTWQQATIKVAPLHTIATLVYHTSYYVRAVSRVLTENVLDAKDKYSFDMPPINSTHDWEQLLDHCWRDAEALARHITQLPESRLWETFIDEKYGNYYRNIHGVIEHTHYHLGQIVLLKKLQAPEPSA